MEEQKPNGAEVKSLYPQTDTWTAEQHRAVDKKLIEYYYNEAARIAARGTFLQYIKFKFEFGSFMLGIAAWNAFLLILKYIVHLAS